MSANRATSIGFCEVAIKNKDLAAFKKLIADDITLLDEPYIKGEDITCEILGNLSSQLTFFEYILIERVNLDFLNFILSDTPYQSSKSLLERLQLFLQKKLFADFTHDKEITQVSLTGFHLIVAKCSPATIKTLLEKLPLNIDDLLATTTTPNLQNIPMVACAANASRDTWRILLDRAVDKNKILMQRSQTKSHLLHYVLHYDNTSEDLTCLLAVNPKNQVTYLQTHTDLKGTIYHQVATTVPTDKSYPARLQLLQRATELLTQCKELILTIPSLLFLENHNQFKSPFFLADQNKNENLMTYFLQFVDYEDYFELEKYYEKIFQKINMEAYKTLSTLSIYHLLVLNLYQKRNTTELLCLFIEKFSEQSGILNDLHIKKINGGLSNSPNNTRDMIKNINFSFYVVMKKIPLIQLSFPDVIISKLPSEPLSTWIYRKVLFDMLWGAEQELASKSNLSDNINNKLTWLSQHADLAFRVTFDYIKLLFSKPFELFPLLENECANKNPNRFATALASQRLAEDYFLFALCYRYGKGVGISAAFSVFYLIRCYSKLHEELSTTQEGQLKKNITTLQTKSA